MSSEEPPVPPPSPAPAASTSPAPPLPANPALPPSGEVGGRSGPDPVRYGDWEKNGICVDF